MCVANDLIELEENVYPPSEEIAESVDPHWALVDTIGTNTRVGCVVAVCSGGRQQRRRRGDGARGGARVWDRCRYRTEGASSRGDVHRAVARAAILGRRVWVTTS